MEKLFDAIRKKSHILLILWLTAIFIGSSIPGKDMPEGLPPDYVLHFLEYAILGFFSYLWLKAKVFKKDDIKTFIFGALIPSLYGVLDEFYQGFIPGRYRDPRDWMTDTLGGVFGVIVCMLVFYYIFRENGKKRAYQGNIKGP